MSGPTIPPEALTEEARAKVRAEEAARQPPEHIMQFFAYQHLPPHLQAVSAPFSALAAEILLLPGNPERTVALRKLLESKDAAVRTSLAG